MAVSFLSVDDTIKSYYKSEKGNDVYMKASLRYVNLYVEYVETWWSRIFFGMTRSALRFNLLPFARPPRYGSQCAADLKSLRRTKTAHVSHSVAAFSALQTKPKENL